jgi:RNA polymerase sigma-70 factor (ECF subfamily)
MDRFKGGSSVRTWLVGILKHKIIDYFRKSAREVATSDLAPLGDETEAEKFDRLGRPKNPPAAWRENPANLFDNKEFWKVFLRCLDGLPQTFRNAFSLREMDGLTSHEICKILSITPTNLWVILHRSRGKLRDCLAANWFREGPK